MITRFNHIQLLCIIFFLSFVLTLLFSCSTKNDLLFDLTKRPLTTEVFAEGMVSTALFERDMAIAPNGKEMIYTVGNFDQSKRCLVVRKLKDEDWTKPEILSFSGEFQDIEPFYTQNGNRLFFASNRPLTTSGIAKDYDIWYVDRSTTGWATPQRLGDHINTTGDEFYPSVSATGNLYFTATREDGIGREDIFVANYKDGNYSTPQVLDSSINSIFFEFNAYIHPDENLIIYSSYGRADDIGGGDLYLSSKDDNGRWLPAKNLGSKINSTGLDYCPFIDLPRGNFYFTSDRQQNDTAVIKHYKQIWDLSMSHLNGGGNIFRVDIDSVVLNPLK